MVNGHKIEPILLNGVYFTFSVTSPKWISVLSEDVEILPEWIEPTNSHLTLVKVGYVDAASLLPIPGANDVHLLFTKSTTGRMSAEQWQAFLATMQGGNREPVLVIHDQSGIHIHEGNHRIRACAALGLPVLLELRCYAGMPG
jgi:hypothetical protein